MQPKNTNIISYIALLCAILAVVLQLESRASFNERVTKTVDEREREHCAQLISKLNQSRELIGLEPITPKNFPELLSGYLEIMSSVANE